jgi:PAS domain S-box-containing protein
MTLWTRLIQPSIPIESAEKRRQMSLLSSSLIGLIILGTLLTVLPFILEPANYPANDPVNWVSAFTIVMLIGAYSLNRRGFYSSAAGLTLGIIVAAIVVNTLTNPPDSYDILNYMIIPVLFASILLPLWANTVLVAACIGLMLIIAATSQVQGMFTVPVLFFSIVALLTLLIMRNRDLVEQDRQATLAEGEERFRKIFMEAPMGMAMINKQKRFVRANAHLCTMLGYSVAELQQMSLDDILHPEDRRYESAPDTQQPIVQAEQRCVTRGGNILWITITASLIREKNIGYGLLMIENITRRKQMEEEARKAEILVNDLAKAREMTEFRSRFLSLVSHEFRTPLTGIVNSSTLLERYYDRMEPEARQENFRRINDEVTRLTQMVDDLLEVSRNEYGQVKFTPHPLNLSAFCENLVHEIRTTNGSHHRIKFTHEGDLESVVADGNLLRPILNNLIYNAIKYTPDDGNIQLVVRREAEHVMLRVSDEGIGIPKHDQAHIFEPFYRASNVGTIKGTGLGLRIVRDYVMLHGGTISFTSEQGEGTIFTICLPVEAQGEALRA